QRVWPDSFVEEVNLAYHISLLRKALGESRNERQYIVTISGQGYRFVADVKELQAESKELIVHQNEVLADSEIGATLSEGNIANEQATERKATASATRVIESIISRIARPKRRVILAPAMLVIASTVLFFSFTHTPALTEADSVMLADFVNTTGDKVFDNTLKLALALQLEQSPFLNIFPDQQVRETLRYMNRSPESPVTRETAREVCERQGLKALLAGS